VAVEGTLDAFALSDVLRLLAASEKTGSLSVDGDRGRGRVEILDGELVAATTDSTAPTAAADEVMFELMRFTRGSFRFSVDEQPMEVDGEPLEIEDVLGQATELLDEWRDLEGVVPSLHHRVLMAQELDTDQVTIDARLWGALVAVAASRTAGDLAAALGLGELGVARLVSDLVDLGVAVVEPPSPRPARSVGAAAVRS